MKARMILVCLMLAALASSSAGGDHGGCTHCGCKAPVKKVCRLVCEEKEIKEVKWNCICEDFCLPCPSEICGEKCHCDPSKPHGEDCEKIWKPSQSAKVYTRKILVKKEVAKKVPSYKWVVEYCCDQCRCDMSTREKPTDIAVLADRPPFRSTEPRKISPASDSAAPLPAQPASP